jgi:hypothetical protein
VSNPQRLHRQRPPLARREPPRPALGLTPGIRLRTAILRALSELESDADAERVHDELRGALAYTAAVGETCMVALAADAVREASSCLVAGELTPAVAALADAGKYLSALDLPLPDQVSQPPETATLPA